MSPLLTDTFIDKLKDQSFSIIMLVCFTYYFYTKVDVLEAKVDDCNKLIRQQYIDQIKYMQLNPTTRPPQIDPDRALPPLE